MKLEELSETTLRELWSDVEGPIRASAVLEQGAQEFAATVHSSFEDSVVLARVYLTCGYESLPEQVAMFVRALADGAGATQQLKPTTPVLTLVGTHGVESNWNDRRKSRSHIGIPLVTASFVNEVPMMARLLRELGVPAEWADHHDFEVIRTMGTGLFFVEDAATATDHQGRKIIPAQSFVRGYEVKSVFGAGAPYPNGQFVVLIVFTRDVLARESAEEFLPLVESFRDETLGLVDNGSVFVIS